ncbi:MAG: CinA family protein [Nitrospiraceae bacterium]|nr:MAG: CinA family protein [Nitrospiraceae bacterium]
MNAVKSYSGSATIYSMKQEIFEAISKVHEFFRNKGLTLSVAESCTGGLISHFITALPGAGKFFTAGITAYSEEIKRSILGISPDAISGYGVVSDEIAREMAEKVRLLSKTDYAVSATGNLGPDALEGKERGLVYIAAGRVGKTVSRELRLKGNRDENKEEAALAAMRLLIELTEIQG